MKRVVERGSSSTGAAKVEELTARSRSAAFWRENIVTVLLNPTRSLCRKKWSGELKYIYE
jgi:hypothetical protein